MKWQNEYLPNVKFCQVLSGHRVAEIRRSEFAKYSERHESYRFSWTSKSRKAFSFRGDLPPGPWTLLGAPPRDPRYRLALRARHRSPLTCCGVDATGEQSTTQSLGPFVQLMFKCPLDKRQFKVWFWLVRFSEPQTRLRFGFRPNWTELMTRFSSVQYGGRVRPICENNKNGNCNYHV